jgi:ATP-binding cassette subfamily B protein
MGKTIRAMRLMATIMPLNIFILNLGVVAVLWLGGTGEWDGIITVGQIVAFINYLQRILFSLMMVGMLLTRISRSLVSAERVTEILDEKPAISFPEAPSGGKTGHAAPAAPGKLEYRDVTFAYDGTPVLKNISFTVNPGETVAVMGATGSGKTSLVHLIPRFYDVTSGEILLDGRDLREYSQEEIRNRIIIVQQETLLFSGTIGDNIKYGKPEAPLEEVRKAAETARIAAFIEQLPQGYDTPIGQRGVGLSGGQKQRVAIARALLTRPSVLILDDCTSAVDMETENEIRNSLREYSTGMTTLIVAQRLSSVYRADRIIILENGRTSAQGTHPELLRTSSVYQEIYNSQLGKWGAEHAE